MDEGGREAEPRHSRGGDDLVLGSPDQQHRALEPSEQSSREGELRESQATAEAGVTDLRTHRLSLALVARLNPSLPDHE